MSTPQSAGKLHKPRMSTDEGQAALRRTLLVGATAPDISQLPRHLVVGPPAQAVVHAGVICTAAHALVVAGKAREVGDERAVGEVARAAPRRSEDSPSLDARKHQECGRAPNGCTHDDSTIDGGRSS